MCQRVRVRVRLRVRVRVEVAEDSKVALKFGLRLVSVRVEGRKERDTGGT